MLKDGCRKATNLAVLLAALFLFTAARIPAWAQDELPNTLPEPSEAEEATQPEDARPQAPDIRVLSNLVVTPVAVIDSSGEFVYDLKQSDFEIFDNGAPQRIESFESEPRKMAVVIVVQTSRSVEPLLKDVHSLGPVFSSLLLGPEGQAAVITYGDRVRLVQDFTGDSDQLAEALSTIGPEGVSGRLNDALMRGIAVLERRATTERRILVAFSNGYDEGSESKSEEVVRRATGSDVAIYGLGFNPAKGLLARKPELPPLGPLDTNVTRPVPPGGAPTPTASANVYDTPIPVVDITDATGQVIQSAVASSLLEFYAGYTGGVFYSHWKKKTLADQLSRIAAEVHSQYELTYVPDTLAQAGFHRIQVAVNRPGVKIRARAGYFFKAPAAPAEPSRSTSAPAPDTR
jgi:VWFA-related protein